MLLQASMMALGESAIEVKYNGNKLFATIVIDADGGAGASPLVKLGVSDTDLATAVTNAVTVFTGLTTSTLKNLVDAITNGSGGTVDADDDIKINDFACRPKDGILSETIYHATALEFGDEAGTGQNLVNEDWWGTLVRDNDAEAVGAIYIRVAPPAKSQGPVAIRSITGISNQAGGTAISNGIIREILNDDSDVLWVYSDTTPTAAEAKFDLEGAVVFSTPVIVRDRCRTISDYAEMDETSTTVAWGVPPNVK